MRNKYICVLIDTRVKGAVGILKLVKALQNCNFLVFQGDTSFVDLVLFCVCLCHITLSVSCRLVIVC